MGPRALWGTVNVLCPGGCCCLWKGMILWAPLPPCSTLGEAEAQLPEIQAGESTHGARGEVGVPGDGLSWVSHQLW